MASRSRAAGRVLAQFPARPRPPARRRGQGGWAGRYAERPARFRWVRTACARIPTARCS